MTTNFATVDGVTMRWEEQGDGVPVVLVHGIPTSPALWRHVVPRLEGCRCLAWEMVGYGASIPEGRDRDISVAAQAGYLVRWMEHLGFGPTVLAGHDLGGGVVQIAAVRNRDRCRGLFLTNAICYDSWPIPSVQTAAATGAAVRHMPMPALREFLRLFFQRAHVTSDQAEEAFAAHWPHYEAHEGAAAFVRQVQSLDNADTKAVADDLPRPRRRERSGTIRPAHPDRARQVPPAPVPYPAIERHGAIWDRRTAALVAADGTLNWLCLPNYDSPPVFAALIDARRGGFWRFGPDYPALGRQRYLPDTPTLITEWEDPDGVLELRDVMLWPESDRADDRKQRRVVLRRIRCRRGNALARFEVRPRDDFGGYPEVSATDNGLRFRLGSRSLCLWTSFPVDVARGQLCPWLASQDAL